MMDLGIIIDGFFGKLERSEGGGASPVATVVGSRVRVPHNYQRVNDGMRGTAALGTCKICFDLIGCCAPDIASSLPCCQPHQR